MPGGIGGMDLYVVHRENGTWTNPVNLGATINTKDNELFPFIHPEGYLFFSSNGHEGKGGLDLFVTARDSVGAFTRIQHLAAPFNSSRDDLGLIVSADGTSGYMASDRKPTKGKDDLYRWTSSQSIFCAPLKPFPDARMDREIIVLDDDGTPLDNTHVWLIPMNQEGPSRYKDHFLSLIHI